MVGCVDCFVGVTLELRVSAVFQGLCQPLPLQCGQALRAPHEGVKVVKLYTPATSFLLEAESIPGP